MSSPLDVIALLTPRPGAADRVQELLESAAEKVKKNEPGTLRYHIQREEKGDKSVFVMLETYANKKALEEHGKTDYFKEMGRTMKKEDLLAEPMKIMFTRSVGGFESKL